MDVSPPKNKSLLPKKIYICFFAAACLLMVFSLAFFSGKIKIFTMANASLSTSTLYLDSAVIPSSTASYDLGNSTAWRSINNLIYFNGANVGIGVSSSQQTLEINGGWRINTTTAQPTCDATQRGTFWVIQSASQATDTVQVCVKNAADAYIWFKIY